jgi:hypothetical protein
MSTATTLQAPTAPGQTTSGRRSRRAQVGAPPAAGPERLSFGKGHLAVWCPRPADAGRARSTTRSRCPDEDRRGAVRWRCRCRAEGTGRLVDLAARPARADHHRPGQPPPPAAPARAASGAAAGGPIGLQRLSFGKGHLAAFAPTARQAAESAGLPTHFGPMACEAAPTIGRKRRLPDLVSENGFQYAPSPGDDCVSAKSPWALFAVFCPIGRVSTAQPAPPAAAPIIARRPARAAPRQQGGAVELRVAHPNARSGQQARRAPGPAPSRPRAARPATLRSPACPTGAAQVRR